MAVEFNAFDSKIARPYATAVFEFAVEQNQLDLWSQTLAFLATIANDDSVQKFIVNPDVTIDQAAELFIGLCHSGECAGMTDNFISLLATNKRLGLLPEITRLYESMVAMKQQELKVEVVSVFPLSSEQQIKIKNLLEKKFKSNVVPNYVEDKSIIGGVMVRIGDRIIDGSVLGRLANLRTKI